MSENCFEDNNNNFLSNIIYSHFSNDKENDNINSSNQKLSQIILKKILLQI